MRDKESFEEGVKIAQEMVSQEAYLLIDKRRKWVKQRKPLGWTFRMDELNRLYKQFTSDLVK